MNAERPPAGGGQRCARYLGLVFSTTECGAAAAAEDGAEAYVSLPMRGAVGWHGCPAFELGAVPELVLALLDELAAAGWDLSAPGWLSQAWRQHDLALIDADSQPLLPALSWQCNGAQAESALLNGLPGFRSAVGAVEARFIAAKLPWALAREPRLRGRLAAVMTSGDWFAGRLTGNRFRLSSSDALSNGLLDQQTKQLATVPLRQANDRLGDRLQPAWFPPVIASNGAVGTIEAAAAAPWRQLGERLRGWRVAALLGDNHASAAGCGAAEYDTMVLSLGTSGTVNLPAPPSAQPSGDILAFEYWDDRLFLLMLAQCGAWYERFRAELNRRGQRRELARRALAGGGPAQGGPAQGGPAQGGPAQGGPAQGGPAQGVQAQGVQAQGVPASREQQPGEAAGEQAAGEHAGDAPQRDARKRDAVERNARMWGEWQPTLGYDELNRLAVACDPERIVRLPEPPAGIDGAGGEGAAGAAGGLDVAGDGGSVGGAGATLAYAAGHAGDGGSAGGTGAARAYVAGHAGAAGGADTTGEAGGAGGVDAAGHATAAGADTTGAAGGAGGVDAAGHAGAAGAAGVAGRAESTRQAKRMARARQATQARREQPAWRVASGARAARQQRIRETAPALRVPTLRRAPVTAGPN